MAYDFSSALTDFFDSVIPVDNKGSKYAEYLERYNFHNLAPWLLRDLDNSINSEIKASVAIYRAMYMSPLRDEFIKINNALEENGIKAIFFKGFVLEADAYDGFPRIFTDNDFICKEKDIPDALNILKKLGYVYKTWDGPAETGDIKLPEGNEWYQIGMVHNSSKGSFAAETHARLMPESMGIDFDIEALFKRAVKHSVYGADTYVMDIHDRVIYLMLHFLKDYRYQINWMMQWTMETLTDIRKLFDIALLIDKSADKFNWDSFLYNISEMDILPEISYVIRFFDRIFPCLVPDSIIKRVSFFEDSSRLMFEYLGGLSKCHIDDLIRFEIGDTLRDIISSEPGRKVIPCHENLNTVSFSHTLATTDRILVKELSDVHMRFDCSADNFMIDILYSGTGNTPSLSLKFVNPEYDDMEDLIQNLRINLGGSKEGVLTAYDYVTPKNPGVSIDYSRNILEGKTKIHVGIPWKALNTSLDQGRVIFNAMISNRDSACIESKHILSGSCWDSIKECGMLEFLNSDEVPFLQYG